MTLIDFIFLGIFIIVFVGFFFCLFILCIDKCNKAEKSINRNHYIQSLTKEEIYELTNNQISQIIQLLQEANGHPLSARYIANKLDMTVQKANALCRQLVYQGEAISHLETICGKGSYETFSIKVS